MPRMIHNLLCTVSRRYRVAHCRHVDELPPRMSRRLYKECTESLSPKSYATFDEMLADMEREWAEEDRAAATVGTVRKAAAVFA